MLSQMQVERAPWSVFDELEALQADMNRVFSGWEPARHGPYGRRQDSRGGYPLLNVWSSAEGLVIDAELPGVAPDAVDISVKGDELTLQGSVSRGDLPDGVSVYRQERPEGSFVRTLRLPFRASTEKVSARYRNGILRITVPRPEEEKPRKIAIEA